MIEFADATLRDGQQSLWAEGMKTGMMVAVGPEMDEIGFKSIEIMAISHILKCVRELREDPWERIRLVSKRVRKTPLTMMIHHSISAFDLSPFSLYKLLIERIAANGIRRVQFNDPVNDMGFRIPRCVQCVKEVGLQTVMGLVFSESPKHTDEYYGQKAKEAAKLGVDAIYIKDSGGLLTPERARTLIPVIFQNSSGVPIELHSHCTTGLAPLTYLEAVKLGIRTIHTAIPPLANGSSLPSVLNVINNLKHLGYSPTIDENGIEPVVKHFTHIARREGFPMGTPVEYSLSQYIHQVPGGVISNLKHQLSNLKMGDRLEEVMEEVVQVRKDLGYPIMVTPFSQFVVSQASINVMMGERYKQVTDEVIKYALGFWGKEASSSVGANVLDRILSLPRTKELSTWEAPEASLSEIRSQLGGSGVTDEELLLRYIVRERKEIEAMRAAGPAKEYSKATNLLVVLIEELLKCEGVDSINVQKGDFLIRLKC